MTDNPTYPVLQVKNLCREFTLSSGLFSSQKFNLKAVQDVNFEIEAGETLAIVGESGCGKTTTTRMILRLNPPTSGQILVEGRDIFKLDKQGLKQLRQNCQAVFQDPWSSLNPRMRVRDIVAEALIANARLEHFPKSVKRFLDKKCGKNKKLEQISDSIKSHSALSRAEIDERVEQTLIEVGLRPDQMRQFPHEFSGGQRQRIAIASALICQPKLIILDEPVSALDVSIRSQIMNLFKDIQQKYGVSYLLVAHDLATTRYLADKVAVMYLGRIVEIGLSEEIFSQPRHPYTQALFSAALPSHPDSPHHEIALEGEPASPLDPPSGCPFHPRCPANKLESCSTTRPLLQSLSPVTMAACHLT